MKDTQTTFQATITDTQVSALQKYQNTVLGKSGLGYLIKFELIMLLCSWVPGALGFLLRKLLYSSLFLHVGRGVVFGRNVVLRHPHKIRIGNNVVIDDDCVLDAKGCQVGEFQIGDQVILSRGCILSAKYGALTIGENTNFGANCLVYAAKHVTIGRDTLFAAQCYVGGGRYYIDDPTRPPIQQSGEPRGVSIGDGCWLGAGVKVIDGMTVGDGVVLGAGAVVSKDLASLSVAVGVPAKVIRLRGET